MNQTAYFEKILGVVRSSVSGGIQTTVALAGSSSQYKVKRPIFFHYRFEFFLVWLIILSIDFFKSLNINMLDAIFLVVGLANFYCDRIMFNMDDGVYW